MAMIDDFNNLHIGPSKEYELTLPVNYSFVIKRIIEDGSYQYFWGISQSNEFVFINNINLALEFGSYEHAMEHISVIDKGAYMIEKIIYN